MHTVVSVMIGAVLIVGIGSLVYFQTRAVDNVVAENGVIGAVTYATADIATHADETSCWTIINGSVYDLTAWIPEHPGGPQAILKLCGTDGSERFNGQHGGMQPMEGILAGFKVGELAQ